MEINRKDIPACCGVEMKIENINQIRYPALITFKCEVCGKIKKIPEEELNDNLKGD